MFNDQARGAEEDYSCAVSTSDLRVDLRRRGDADAIIAAGWNKARIGAALMRLHTEFDKVPKPKAMAPEVVRRIAASITVSQLLPLAKEVGIQVGTLRPAAAADAIASAQAKAWHEGELRVMLGRLTEFAPLRQQLAKQVHSWGLGPEESTQIAVDVMRWWLCPRCGSCNGTKWQLIPGSNRQSGIACRECRGSGESPVPHGSMGARLLGWMNECRGAARSNIRGALRDSLGHD